MRLGATLNGKSIMQDRDLLRTAEHLWNAWLDLNYAYADLSHHGANDAIRLEIGASVEKLRAVAETLDMLASVGAPAGERPQTDRRLTKCVVYPCRRDS